MNLTVAAVLYPLAALKIIILQFRVRVFDFIFTAHRSINHQSSLRFTNAHAHSWSHLVRKQSFYFGPLYDDEMGGIVF